MAATSYFFDFMTVEMKQGANVLTVGVLQDVTVKPTLEHVELYGAGSIKREDVARRKLAVEVAAKAGRFHPNIEGYIMGTQNAGKDIEGAVSAANTQGVITDSNTVTLFQLTGTLTGKNGEIYKARAKNVYFEPPQWGGSAGEYVALDLKGKGDDYITQFVTT